LAGDRLRFEYKSEFCHIKSVQMRVYWCISEDQCLQGHGFIWHYSCH